MKHCIALLIKVMVRTVAFAILYSVLLGWRGVAACHEKPIRRLDAPNLTRSTLTIIRHVL